MPIRLCDPEQARALAFRGRNAAPRIGASPRLGPYANVFAIESTIDELALIAEADPVQFRQPHGGPASRAVDRGWRRSASAGTRGKCPAPGALRFRPLQEPCRPIWPVAMEVDVEPNGPCSRGPRRFGIDSGEIVNRTGIRNQTEGGILKAISWTLYEAVAFDRTRITSTDGRAIRSCVSPVYRKAWRSTSSSVRGAFPGHGEGGQGPCGRSRPNAIRGCDRKRLYDLPFTRDRIRSAVGRA